MPEPDDIALLRQYADNGSERAFAALVERHVNLVYSVALRRVGNPQAADEIVQAVFIILARKAKSLGASTVLTGWLYQTARLTAANFLRGEIRRQKREQEAFMQSHLTEPEADAWSQIAPILDDAMARLGERDRNAILLRFFENKGLRAVGAELGASEDAAKMRVNRALGKLRNFFLKRGITFSAAAIAGVVSANSVHAAPAGLAQSVAAMAAAKGAALSSSTLTLVKGALKIMAWTKAKTTVVIGVAAILVVTSSTVIGIKITQANRPIAKQATGLSPIAQTMTTDIQPDGTIVIQGTMEETNSTSRTITTDGINDVDSTWQITDESGQSMRITGRPGGGIVVTLNHAVRPGGIISYTVKGKMPGFFRKNEAGEYEAGMLGLGNVTEAHVVQVWRLPPGATLLSKDRGMEATTNAGQIELRIDRRVPPNSTFPVGFRYRLPAAAN